MRRVVRTLRRALSQGLPGLALLALFPFSCQQRQPTASAPVPPPAPPAPALTLVQQGDQAFDAGDYANALAAYTAYLREQPSGPEGDQALFRLALLHVVPDSSAGDTERAATYLNELVSRFPQSSLRPQAELFLQMQQQMTSLRAEIAQREIQVEVLGSQITELRQAGGAELEQLRADLKGREERVRQLSEELEQLKAIDMRRRTTPPR